VERRFRLGLSIENHNGMIIASLSAIEESGAAGADRSSAGCQAHVCRGIFEAKDQARIIAAWLVHQIGLLHAVPGRDEAPAPRIAS